MHNMNDFQNIHGNSIALIYIPLAALYKPASRVEGVTISYGKVLY